MEEIKQKSWFGRNWGWVLGGGCLTIIIVFALAIGGIIYKVSDSITSSEPYTYSYSKAIENEQVIKLLGTPIEKNGIGSTNFSYKNGSSTASLTIPVKGSKDEGQIVVEAEKINDEWSYNKLYVKIDGETERINLLDAEIEESLNNF